MKSRSAWLEEREVLHSHSSPSLVVVTCVGAAIALGQIKLLKSEIGKLQRELGPFSVRLAKLEQTEKTKKRYGASGRRAEQLRC